MTDQMGHRAWRVRHQAVADFISEFTLPTNNGQPIDPVTAPPSASVDSPSADNTFDQNSPHWTLYVDGSSNRQGSSAGLVLKTPDDTIIEYAIRFQFRASNNEAEYEALLAGLRLAQSSGVERLMICSDSQLVVNQVPRSENSHTDALSRLASAIDDRVGRHVPIEVLARRSTAKANINTVRQDPCWMDPIHAHLTDDTLPIDKAEAKALLPVVAKMCYTTTRRLHLACGDHLGSRSLAFKAVRRGYYWPTFHPDATQIMQRCDPYQNFGSVSKVPAEPLSPMTSPWPFAQWGLDLIGLMPQGTGQLKFAVVAVDYFTKWTEAEALATITAAKIEHFVEAINKIIKKTLKKKLGAAKGNWRAILPEALWAINTSYRRSTGETPFSLAFGTEPVVPVEVHAPICRTTTYNPQQNEQQLALNLDLIDER
ncbi:unnamed protein product [Prunus armeniaca]